jgi:4'-phosphopantetheinyl transferase EntD
MNIPTTNLDLARSIEVLTMPGVLIGHRFIAEGDELALWPGEVEAFANSVNKVKRASGAARIVARGLMRQLGHTEQIVPRSATGAPVWPQGLVGSLAHDSQVAVAAMAHSNQFQSLGIDVEPAEPLEPKLLSLVATASEAIRIAEDPCRGRLLFAVKEAVYKTLNPLDGQFLDHHDVEVNLASGQAITRTGHAVQFRYGLSSHIVVLAFK